MGEVVEIGSGINRLDVGDMVAVPFNVACGHCKNCERGFTSYCVTAQPREGFAGAAYDSVVIYGAGPVGLMAAHDPQGHEHPNATLNNLVACVRFTGGIGVVAVFVPEDPGGPDELARHGEVAFDYGMFWFDNRDEGWTKVVLAPGKPNGREGDSSGRAPQGSTT
jgi:Alcohol dehydrogenase GroES-like domain